jgi:hypothetical protein
MMPYPDICPVAHSSKMIKLFRKSKNFEKLISEIEASSVQNATTNNESYDTVDSVFWLMTPYADSCHDAHSSEMIKLFRKSKNFKKQHSEIGASSARNATTTESYNTVDSVFWLIAPYALSHIVLKWSNCSKIK